MIDGLPSAWVAETPQHDFQIGKFSNTETGEILVIEAREEPWHADIEPPDIRVQLMEAGSEPDVAEVLDLVKNTSRAQEVAENYMNEHDSPAR